MAASKPTSWLSGQPHILLHLTYIGDLSCGSGLFPLDNETYLTLSDCCTSISRHSEFDRFGSLSAPSPFSALPPVMICNASPKAISGRTSYIRVRLEFLRYPHLIRRLFNGGRFGPPWSFTSTSAWTWIGHPVSGHIQQTHRPFQTRSPCGFGPEVLNLACYIHSPDRSTKSTLSHVDVL